MTVAIDYYSDFLTKQQEKIDNFFKNYPLFENQFKYNDFNDACYQEMFSNNNKTDIKSVKSLKETIPELKEICAKCGAFFLKPRNKSVKGLDVQLGIFLEDRIIEYLNSIHIHALHADNSNKRYPDCMILGKDKGIIAYFEVKYHCAPFITAINNIHRYCYEGSVTLDYNKIIKQLEVIDSDLDRPTFYLHWIDYPCLKGIFFETNEQVKNNLYSNGVEFERAERDGDYKIVAEQKLMKGYLKKYYSPLLEMGTFDEFINLIHNMEK